MSWFDTVPTAEEAGAAPRPAKPRLRAVDPSRGRGRAGPSSPVPKLAERRTLRSVPHDGERGTAFQVGMLAGRPVLQWHVAEPGPRLAELLADLDHQSLEKLDDYDVVEFVAAAERLASWAHHLALRGAAELSTRKSMTPPVDVELALDLPAERVAGAELGLRLGSSPRAGRELVRLGLAFRSCLAATGESLASGRIDVPKARAIVDGLREAPTQLAVVVQDAVLPRAHGRTARQLAADVRAALVQLDPGEAAKRHAEAARTRFLGRPVPLPDGMAGMWLRTTAPRAHALYAAVDEAARVERRAGDGRTLDQLRADLLCEGLGWGEGLGRGEGLPRDATFASAEGPRRRQRQRLRADVRVLVPLSTLLGTSQEPGELAGYGPIDPDTARCLARGGTWRRLVTDPASGTVLDVGRSRYEPPADLAELVRQRDRTCVSPTCDTSAWSCELDHTEPFRPGEPQGGSTAAHNLGALSKGCHILKTHAGFELEQPTPGEFWWTTPTGHRYARDPVLAVPGLDPAHPIHSWREDLVDLDPPPEPPPTVPTVPTEDPARRSPGPPPF